MALDAHFLNYPMRRHGMDHDRYPWSNLFERKPLALPHNAKVAVMVTVPLEFFPLNPSGKPFKAPGSMVTNYPDFRHYTTRDYGNRVGIFRLMRVFEQFGVRVNMALNSAVAERYPTLVEVINDHQHEIVAHGVDMDTLHYGGMDSQQERTQIQKTIETLRQISGQAVEGWISPAFSESVQTPDLLTECGIQYIGDWANDELPYEFSTTNGTLTAIPVSQEINDRQIIINYHHSEDSFVQQVIDQFDYLYDEANQYGGRVLSLVLTPYISGLPYRIRSVKAIFEHLASKTAVCYLTGSQLNEQFRLSVQ